MTLYIRKDETEITSEQNQIELISGWSVVDHEDKFYGFYNKKVRAIRQAIAIAKSVDEPYMGDWKYRERPQEKPLE